MAQLTDLLLLLRKYKCGPLRIKYRNFQELYLSPFLRIHPVWSGSPIWSIIFTPFTPCVRRRGSPFTVLPSRLRPVPAKRTLEFEVVRLCRTAGSFSFSFSLSSDIPKKSRGIFLGDPPEEVEGRRVVDDDLRILELCNLGRLNLDD